MLLARFSLEVVETLNTSGFIKLLPSGLTPAENLSRPTLVILGNPAKVSSYLSVVLYGSVSINNWLAARGVPTFSAVKLI